MADYTPTGIIHNTSVDFTRRVISEPVHIVQGDRTLPTLAVELLSDGQPYTVPDGAQVNIALNKKDGTFVLNKADSVDGNIATFTITAQMTVVAGDFTPEVQIVNGAGQATTGKFPYIVDKAEIQEGMLESTSEFTSLIDYADRAESYAHGGTGTRDGEDADNAYAYMKKAQEAANGTIDGEMSDTSTNAVQNKVIKAYVDGHTPTLNEATDTASGLMSAADKAKLDGIDPSAITTNAANIKKNADAISAEATRAKNAEAANTKLTNDLQAGITSGSVKAAKAGTADSASALGMVSTYQTEIPDNFERRKYLLMYDITDWISAKSNASARAFDGYFISRRGEGFVKDNCNGNLSIVASYGGVNENGSAIKSDNGTCLRLRTTSSAYAPKILHQKSNDKYYLALETYGNGRDLVLFGIFQGTFIGTWINNEGTPFTDGTLPSDYEEYSDDFYVIPSERAVCDKNGKDITEYLASLEGRVAELEKSAK